MLVCFLLPCAFAVDQAGPTRLMQPLKRERLVPYGILVSLIILMLACLAFCVLDFEKDGIGSGLGPASEGGSGLVLSQLRRGNDLDLHDPKAAFLANAERSLGSP